MKKFIVFIVLLAMLNPKGYTQERLLTVGFQYKPLLSSQFFGSGPVENTKDILKAEIKPIWGHNYGMMIRRGFTKSISYEVGINYVKRNYRLTCTDLDSGFTSSGTFSLVSYEIPNQMLIYVRLGERFYMNNAFGVALTAFASDVESYAENRRFHELSLLTTRWFSASMIANVGFEYRTEKSGFFYIGASLQRPFKNIANTTVTYEKTNLLLYSVPLSLSGAYLTLDFRYFFHEQPVKEKKNKSKKKK